MGGLGSGSWQVAQRPLAESCAVLRVRDVARCTATPAHIYLRGARRIVAYVHQNAVDTRLVIADATTSASSHEEQWIRLVTTRQHLGGRRCWFACPGCGGRCGVLFRPTAGAEWRCRTCHGVAYRSQRIDDAERMFLRAARLRARVAPSIFAEAWALARGAVVPVKRRGTRWSTWERAQRKAEMLELRAFDAAIAPFEREARQLIRSVTRRRRGR